MPQGKSNIPSRLKLNYAKNKYLTIILNKSCQHIQNLRLKILNLFLRKTMIKL